MKILYHHRIASKDGQYVHVEELTKALRQLGHEIIMVGPSVVENNQFGFDGGLISLMKSYVPKFLYEILEFSYSFYAYKKLASAVKKHKPDVIYERYNIFMPAGVWIKKKYCLPLLLEVNAPLYQERHKYNGIALKSLAQWTERYAWRNADRVLPVTHVLANIMTLAGVDEHKMTVIPNGIDPEKFGDQIQVLPAKKVFGLNGKVVLGFTGFMREWHGLDKIVDVLKESGRDDCHLLFVGDGPARSSIEKRAKQLGVESQVTITGIVDRDKVAGYVAAFDIALQPDVVDYASPLKLFEYMALGKAIVAPGKDNIKEILKNRVNGLLFDPNDSDALIKTVTELLNDEALRETLGIKARHSIDEMGLTWTNNAKKVEHLYRDLLDLESG